jgi:hypothetical protein
MSHGFDKAAALAWIRKSLTVNHGNKLVEAARHQRAIVAADFLLVRSIVDAGTFQIGNPTHGRDGTKRVVLHTLWIRL